MPPCPICSCSNNAPDRFEQLTSATQLSSLARSESDDGAFEQVTNQCGDGKGENPGPDDSFDHGPFHSAETFDGTDAHDRCRDDVGGGERNTVKTRALNDERGCGLGGEAVYWLQFHDAMAKSANDAPTARGCARGHG